MQRVNPKIDFAVIKFVLTNHYQQQKALRAQPSPAEPAAFAAKRPKF